MERRGRVRREGGMNEGHILCKYVRGNGEQGTGVRGMEGREGQWKGFGSFA